jgi:DNA (cytosine-5)-methyltransferase 1
MHPRQLELDDISDYGSPMPVADNPGHYREAVRHSPDTQASAIAAEFFAGIGLVRLGLEAAGVHVAWSNDVDRDKHDMYMNALPLTDDHHFELADIAAVRADTLPERLSLAWASFPCTDLSLAGWRRGLAGSESSTFHHFTRILTDIGDQRPPVVCLENVTGFATSHGGDDLRVAIGALNDLGYSVDVLLIDARRFVPQSRQRLFLVGAQEPPRPTPMGGTPLRPAWLEWVFADPELTTHRMSLPEPPTLLQSGLSDVVERLAPHDPQWWDVERTAAFLSSLSDIQARRLRELRGAPTTSYRTAYRRTRHRKAVWEVRSDDIAGCLRTARGGSSKQAVVEAGGGQVRVRWMTPREYARLMGADDFKIEGLRRNQALFGFGDAVCVPVVTWLARNYLLPLLSSSGHEDIATAIQHVECV